MLGLMKLFGGSVGWCTRLICLQNWKCPILYVMYICCGSAQEILCVLCPLSIFASLKTYLTLMY
ncbi:hypothetical protein MTR67_022756 [Solanum verrucosum]|uniref:Uncharacterized protein n=1 Tax=Solanum verrucosum TaxID=315347 RepID=A0AAF0QTX9_SOLVR|nr:hypothetical protein MTR67_022756 [Solanum verrucosum]